MSDNRGTYMLRRVAVLAAGIAPLLGTAGCDGDERSGDRTGQTTGVHAAGGVAVTPRADTVVAQPVHWNLHILESTLRSMGSAPVRVGLRSPDVFPNITAAAYQIGEAEVEVYFFGDPLAAARARSRLGPPTPAASAFVSNNMVVVVRAEREEARERIRRALTRPEVEGTLTP